MVNSKQKGKRGELEAVNYLNKKGYSAKRTRQYKGTPESADIECKKLPFHFEIKRVERLDIHKAYRKASGESEYPKIPLVMHRKNQSKKWLATLSMDDLIKIIENDFITEEILPPPKKLNQIRPSKYLENMNFSQTHR